MGGLSGCFLLPLANDSSGTGRGESLQTAAPLDPAAAPEVGDCWVTNFSDLTEWASWEGDGPVNCQDNHQSYTFFVGKFGHDAEQAYDLDPATSALADTASGECLTALESEFDWTPKEQRLSFYFFVPTAEEWGKGDRRFRCDVAVTAIGSDFYHREVADLADISDLKHDVQSNSLSYQLCLTGNGAGPYDGKAIVADCAADYDWRFGGHIAWTAGPKDEPYPSGDSLHSYAMNECPSLGLAQGETVFPYTPSPESWAAGDRSIECWFSTVQTPSSAV
jgi:hypothetical protein